MAYRDFEVACISAPCQSFTTTGNNQGWEHELGTVLAKSIACAAISNTKMIVLENSAQMLQNPKYHQVLKTFLQYWGYAIVASDVVPLERMHPAVRNRSIVLAVQQTNNDLNTPTPDIEINQFIPKNLGGVMADRLGPLPSQLLQQLDLDELEYELFNSLEFMPSFMRHKPKNPPIRRRLVSIGNQKLSSGTSMARHGDQQNLPMSTLKKH